MRPRSVIGVVTILLGGCVMPFSGRPSMDLQRGMTRSEVVAAMGRPDGGWSYPTGEEALQWEWDHWNDGRWGGRYVTAVFDAAGRLVAYGDRPPTTEELRAQAQVEAARVQGQNAAALGALLAPRDYTLTVR